ncbi:MAG: DEAD/DEAH box helicase family protein [Ignavibacteriales bacterium]|nr:DEAD/DEAH box helicase family protein [Ignavibacteriales bacterium]
MDRIKESANVIAKINLFRKGSLDDNQLIESICHYYDIIKETNLTEGDLKFLKYISNIIGIPQYYDLLKKFQEDIEYINSFDLNTFSSMFYESTLHTDIDVKVHKYQNEIIDFYESGKLNRYFLSASTSFGKTFIVYEIIKKMNYKNIVLLFPTIALLSENLERIVSDDKFSFFKNNYSIHTLSEVKDIGENNLFIYTPERFLSFIEKSSTQLNFDFVFVDEVYKIDNEFVIDEQTKENERDVAYRIAVFYSLTNNTDVLFAGPYIEFNGNTNKSFDNFLTSNQIKLLDYNKIETVNKNYFQIKSGKKLDIEEGFKIEFEGPQKTQRLLSLLNGISNKGENSIVYCFRKSSAEKYSKDIIDSDINNNWDSSKYNDFIQHIKLNFHAEWVLIGALEKGIGIHHGLIPKYIQKEIIDLFNEGQLTTLFSTTTITEGVNTSAKNIIVLHNKKGNKNLKKFDAKNISGRAGRFLFHYSGRVFVLKNDFMDTINSETDGIKHKNYDIDSIKDEIDLFYTDDQYLVDDDKIKKVDIQTEQENRQIPEEIIKRFKVVSRKDKIAIYDSILILSQDDRTKIRQFISRINYPFAIDYDGLQVILNVIEPIVKNDKLKFYIQKKVLSNFSLNEYSLFVYLLHFYLRDGFIGSMNYKIENGEKVDSAIRDTADFIYNILKYHAVKYLGVFNLMYRFVKSKEENIAYDDVLGIDRLLLKLEYNAITDKGRLASDYGVPHKVLECYENPNYSNEIKNTFDNYEKKIFDRVEKVIYTNQ